VPDTGVQVPTLFGTLQAWHAPRQAKSQQTPSVQNPDVHSEPVVHTVPLVSLFPQVPVGRKHVTPVPAQSVAEAQPVLHDVASSQTKPPGQGIETPAGHVADVPLHVRAAVIVLPEHTGAAH
jgi:hypothetical protein